MDGVPPNYWKFDPKQSGGGRITLDWGYHLFSLAVHFLGDVEKVFAWITQQKIVHGWILDSPATIVWKYKDAERYGNWDIVSSDGIVMPTKYWPEDEWVEITGTKGLLWVKRCTSMLLDRPALVMYRDGVTTDYSNLDLDPASSFILGTRDWIDALGGPPGVTARPRGEAHPAILPGGAIVGKGGSGDPARRDHRVSRFNEQRAKRIARVRTDDLRPPPSDYP